MRIPHTIYENTIKAYELPSIYLRNSLIKSYDFTWDRSFVRSLRDLCMIVIAENWEKNPIYDELVMCADKIQLIELISTDLPLELTVPIIEDDYYWKRSYQARWPRDPEPNRRFKFAKPGISLTSSNNENDDEQKSVNFSDKEVNIFSYFSGNSAPSFGGIFSHAAFSRGGFSICGFSKTRSDYSINEMPSTRLKDPLTGKEKTPLNNMIIELSWKQIFLQKFVEEEIERMKPDMFNPEYIKELTDLYGEYLLCLNIRQLQPSRKQDGCDHISLHSLLANLPKLVKLTVCFKQSNLGETFTWHTTEVSESDCELLGNGVEKSCLRILRVIRSNIDCDKVKLLIRPLSNHRYLHTLDLSHCKIGDEGAKAIAAMLMTNMVLEKLVLTNNKIGPEGAKGLCYYLNQPDSHLRELDLKLNPLQTEGGKFISTALTRGALNLISLNISSCGLTTGNMHLGLALALNTTLQKLDLSNNHLGEESVPNFLIAMEKNISLIHLDLRMCGLLPQSVQEIQTTIRRNLVAFRNVLLAPPSAENIL